MLHLPTNERLRADFARRLLAALPASDVEPFRRRMPVFALQALGADPDHFVSNRFAGPARLESITFVSDQATNFARNFSLYVSTDSSLPPNTLVDRNILDPLSPSTFILPSQTQTLLTVGLYIPTDYFYLKLTRRKGGVQFAFTLWVSLGLRL
ncbi:MAG: hypothetical protein WAP47_01190 [Candidatus Rokuibacteriota bacterium]